jgi:EAL domain-containing protein (putative c-di-GMP-specific phosphodiesterase class I)
VELTEQAAITNLASAQQMVVRLGALGCRFALDDFGTGANSLTYLKALQVSRVKIDGSFVRDIGLVILLAFTPVPPAQAPTANAQIQGRPSG